MTTSNVSTSQMVIGGLALAAAATLGYAVYFDQKRRSDPEFRRKLSM
jgi:import receptor subunit TOM20